MKLRGLKTFVSQNWSRRKILTIIALLSVNWIASNCRGGVLYSPRIPPVITGHGYTSIKTTHFWTNFFLQIFR